MPSAVFTVNGSPVTGPVLVTASTLTTIALSSLSGAADLACEFIGASDSGVTYPAITLTAPGTWTFTSPAEPAHGYGLSLLLRVTNAGLTATAIISVGSVSQLVPGEYLERGAGGWTYQLNENTRGAAVVDAVLAALPGGFPDASLVTDGMMTTTHVAELNAATAHLTDATDAHAASAISNTPAGTIAATTVQGAIDEIVSDLAASSGATLVGCAEVLGSPKALTEGTLAAQQVEMLGHINAHATRARRIVYPTAGLASFVPATYTALGCSFCRVFAKGGGGGGGAGSGTAGGGGGGGGGSGLEATWVGPLSMLDASMAVAVGPGGTAGNAGGISFFSGDTTTFCIAGGGRAGSAGGATSGGNGGAGCSSGGGGGTGAGGGSAGTSPSQFGGSAGASGSTYSAPNGGAGGGGGSRYVSALGVSQVEAINGSGTGGVSSTGAGNAGNPGVGAGAGGGGAGGASVGGSGGGGGAGAPAIAAGSINGVAWSAAPGTASGTTGSAGLIVIDVW